MAAGLKVDVQVCSPRFFPGAFQCILFSMGTAEKTVIAGTNDFVSPYQNSADQRVRAYPANAPAGKAQGGPHTVGFKSCRRHHACTHRLLPSSTLTSDINSPISLNERYTEAKRT